MSSHTLRAFLRQHCTQHPAARMQLVEFVRLFKQHAADWPRDYIVSELTKAGFKIGVAEKVFWIAGIARRDAEWTAKDGRLQFATRA